MGKQDKQIDLIKDAFDEKTWNEIHTTDSWRVFKIISELVEGYEKLSRIGVFQSLVLQGPIIMISITSSQKK
jgi:hypothetical protein